MCGIVGYIATNKRHKVGREAFFKQALITDQVRGRDSTGVISIGNNFKKTLLRSTMIGHQFVETDVYKDNPLGWAAIGHNRAATRGGVTLKNTHPFQFDDICMVHNGTLVSKGSRLPGFDPSLEVDSMNIAKSLSEVGEDEADKVLTKIDGSFAIVWTDNRDQSINMARNNSRPLHMAINRDNNLLLFMSDGYMLHNLLRYYRDFNYDDVLGLKEGQHLKFKRGSLRPEVRTFVPFSPPQEEWCPTTRQMVPKGMAKPINSGGKGRAQQIAERRWAPSKTGGAGFLAQAMTKHKTTPRHLLHLKHSFELGPADYLRFTAVSITEASGDGAFIQGTIFHPRWGDLEWDADLFVGDVKEARKYIDKDWAVRPIGISKPVFIAPKSDGRGVEGIRCILESYNWDTFAMSNDLEEEAEPVITKSKLSMVSGVGGTMILLGALLKKLEDGCISCGDNLHWENAKNYDYTNDGQDVLCEACKWKFNPVLLH